jgi:hypothetical protein
MAIYKSISNGCFGPDEIKVMTEAYEGALIRSRHREPRRSPDRIDRKIYRQRDRYRGTRPPRSEGACRQRAGDPQDQCGLNPPHPDCLGVQKTDLSGDILNSRAYSFNGRFNFNESFRPVPQLMIRMDVDTRWPG